MKFSFYTLGCKVNQYETQAMQQMLLSHGHTLGEFDEPCDGYIVNSCTVTAVSDKKTRNAIRRAQKLNPNAAVGVCGCYAQSATEEVRALGVDVMVGTADREAFVLQMEQAAQENGTALSRLSREALLALWSAQKETAVRKSANPSEI